jgi:large subunit ribosomal protein LP0
MVKGDKRSWKETRFTNINELFAENDKMFVVGIDNVQSLQMQEIRMKLRGKATILNGKNTMIRKALRGLIATNQSLERLLPTIKGNVGFVFVKSDFAEVRQVIAEERKNAPAKAGAIAPGDVEIPPQPTALGPEKTSFFQALNIPTKITRGTIEILNKVEILKEGQKVGASEATLLNMLNVSPFSYGLVIQAVYDQGSVYAPEILDITEDDIAAKFAEGLSRVASLSLETGYPTKASLPHVVVNGFKNVIAVCLESELKIKQAEKLLTLLSDPEALAAAQAAAAASGGGGAASGGAAAEKKEEKKEESEEESDDDMGFGLFD